MTNNIKTNPPSKTYKPLEDTESSRQFFLLEAKPLSYVLNVLNISQKFMFVMELH